MRAQKASYGNILRLRVLVWLGLLAQVNTGFCGGVVTTFTQAELETALAGGGTVTFSTNGTITLTNTLSITQDTTIDASGYQVTISGGNAARLFQVTNATFRLNGLTLADGRVSGAAGLGSSIPGQDAAGACILDQGGTVSLTACTLTNHSVQGGKAGTEPYNVGAAGKGLGGALCSFGGQINVTNCVIVNCGAQGGAGAPSGPGCGGALYVVGGGLNLQGVTLASDSATGGDGWPYAFQWVANGSAFGGAIYASSNAQLWADSSLLMSNAAISGNSLGFGSGDGSGGAVTLDSTCQAMFNQCVLLGNSAVAGNSAGYWGGVGIWRCGLQPGPVPGRQLHLPGECGRRFSFCQQVWCSPGTRRRVLFNGHACAYRLHLRQQQCRRRLRLLLIQP